MKNIANSTVALMTKFIIVAALVFALPVFNSCKKDDTTEEQKSGSGFSTTMSTDLSCSGAAQSMTFTFSTQAAYTLEVEGGDWFSFAIGASGSKAGNQSAKANIKANPNDRLRVVDIYITVEGYERTKAFTVTQSAVAKADAVVDWIDDRLSTEYYWLDEYNQMVADGKVDYSLAYDKFLSTHLMAMKTNMDDGYLDGNGKRKLYSNIQRYQTSRAETRAEKTKGLGILLNSMIWQLSADVIPTYGFCVEHVYPGSPADLAGLQRGDIIAQVNGSDLTSMNYGDEWVNLVYSGYNNVSIARMVVVDGEWAYETMKLTAGEYYENPVAYCDILKEDPEMVDLGFAFGGKKIGYISYLSFESAFDEELINGLKSLKAQGVTDVIIDLRSNGGGSVMSAAYFGSMLMSGDKIGKNMVVLERNKANMNGTTNVPIVGEVTINKKTIELPHLDLPTVYVITTYSTASASEMLIMGLRANGVKVYTIGETSNGKNCGMDVMARNYGAYTYEFAPITFMAKYDDYDVDYADGIIPDIEFADLIQYYAEDSYYYYAMAIFPLCEPGMVWGAWSYDLAVTECVAQILGGTVFTDDKGNPLINDLGPGMKAFKSPFAKTITRAEAASRFTKSDLKVVKPAEGMRLTEDDRVKVLQAQGIE